jgi:hypothetical protein
VTSVAIWAGLGDVRRFGNSDDVVRHAGLDITVYSSDGKRSPGTCPAGDRSCCAGRCTRRPSAPPATDGARSRVLGARNLTPIFTPCQSWASQARAPRLR